MEKITFIFLFFIAITASGQRNGDIIRWGGQEYNIWTEDTIVIKSNFKSNFIKYDFSSLWTQIDNSYTYGVIGDKNQRLKIKLITATKDTLNADTYHVYGKSMVKNNICKFKGTIEIKSILLFKNLHFGVDEEYKDKGIRNEGVLVGKYYFVEDSTEIHSGIFEGTFATLWYINENGQIKYDDIERASDSYRNNQFYGTWKGYKSNISKICKWGDFRIPFSDDIDFGAGFFSPADKYLQFGWQNLRNANNNDKQAIREEYKKWW